MSGNEASVRDLQVAAAALETVGDVFSRFLVTFGIGSGLRGGEFTYTLQPFGYAFELNRVRWTDDLQVSGRMRWDVSTGNVTADVRLRRGRTQAGTLTIKWNDVQKNAIATLTGTIGNRTIKAKRIAP
jgi:hypothetical protein